MLINPETKISALIKANPESIEAIASISSHFEKLRNPILRKILASRVTIADAARIGGSEVAVFYEKLKPLGFSIEERTVSARLEPTAITTEKPADLPAEIIELDVREALQTGNDPFNEIMDLLAKLKPGQALKLINTFEPTPLFSILQKRGFQHFTETLAADLIHTYFYKTVAETAKKVTPNQAPQPEKNFDALLLKFRKKLQEIDVRNLEMPLPMVTILESLNALVEEKALLVYHRRVPQYLLPQLAERNFAYAIKEDAPDQFRLLIFKDPSHGNDQ